MNITRCYLGLGGNLGKPEALFDWVVQHLTTHPKTTRIAESPRYESTPIDAGGPNYINAVLELHWRGTATELLQTCMHMEEHLGRVRSVRNAPRPIDVDVLLFGEQLINTPDLQVPHPRMHERRFVLQPLLDLSPHIHIPNLGPAQQYLPNTEQQIIQRIQPKQS